MGRQADPGVLGRTVARVKFGKLRTERTVTLKTARPWTDQELVQRRIEEPESGSGIEMRIDLPDPVQIGVDLRDQHGFKACRHVASNVVAQVRGVDRPNDGLRRVNHPLLDEEVDRSGGRREPKYGRSGFAVRIPAGLATPVGHDRPVHAMNSQSVEWTGPPFSMVITSWIEPSAELICQWVASSCTKVAPSAAVPYPLKTSSSPAASPLPMKSTMTSPLACPAWKTKSSSPSPPINRSAPAPPSMTSLLSGVTTPSRTLNT